ncbi:MAG: aminopeptidase N, partial [Nevskiales bacterium]
RWDEEAYGREYDLDIFMIVAVDSFNMGAMENKGLNIFNAKYIIADPQTATDDDHEAVRDIIGHEYFHNWTGNRITCRDWFQLSVKESLTVFREQQFSAAMGSAAIARIRQARLIRTQQFPEDAGPTAHPVRPDSYVEVNNLYTLTVYEKGAEVIRMIHTLLGQEKFRNGMDLYFKRHDGQAVTVEDFLMVMEDVSERDLSQFRLWYSQAGTSTIKARLDYDPAERRHVLQLEQSCPATPGQPDKQPLHIPLLMALIDEAGAAHRESLIEMRQASEQRIFEDLKGPCTLSLLRDFSAPVRLVSDVDERQLRHLAVHSADACGSWDAVQQLFLRELLRRVGRIQRGESVSAAEDLTLALQGLLDNTWLDRALLAEMLQMPGEAYLAEQFEQADLDSIVLARDGLRQELATSLYPQWESVYEQCAVSAAYQPDPPSIARRRLRNVCLGWLVTQGNGEARALALQQYRNANNMTDAQGALMALNDNDGSERSEALGHFRVRWVHQPLVFDKWFTLQASSRLPASLDTVKGLLSDSGFDLRNPNRVRALLGVFAHQNLRGFHRGDGAGYALV